MTEAQEQAKVIKWCRNPRGVIIKDSRLKQDGDGWIVPYIVARNETSRGGRWRTGQGNLKGIPDLFFPITSDINEADCEGEYAGLWIELKQEDGTVSEEQESWIDYFNHAGYYATVCYSGEEAIEVIEDYMAGLL